MMYKVFVVEDDPIIAGVVTAELKRWGLTAQTADDFSAVLSQFTAYDPQLVLLDISLPFFNGYYWCQEIRRISSVPVIFLSSASDNMNIVMAMDMGADDFIPKPFDLTVLMAKVRALLRRTYHFTGNANIIRYGDGVLDLSGMGLSYHGQTIELTRNEFRILQALLEGQGQVVSRDAMMTRLWESNSFIDENTLTVNINRLRHKLSAYGLDGFIATKKGAGYFVRDLSCMD